MSSDLLILNSTDLELGLSPSIGGAISHFRYKGPSGQTPILREGNSPLENVLEAGSFPLVPFVNRIRGGTFSFRGQQVTLSTVPGGQCPDVTANAKLTPAGVVWKSRVL